MSTKTSKVKKPVAANLFRAPAAASTAAPTSAAASVAAATATSASTSATTRTHIDADADTVVSIRNIVVTSETYADRARTNPHLAKLISMKPDLLTLLPTCKLESLSFQLTGYTSLANGIRRALLEETPVDCLTFDDSKLQTDDRYIISDYLRSCVEMLAIQQAEDLGKNKLSDCKFSLNITNTTMREIYVRASDITVTGSGASVWTPYPNTPISKLKPGKNLTISEFSIIRGTANKHAGRFTGINAFGYEILGIDFYDEEKDTGVKSEECMPSEFQLSFRTKSNIPPVAYLQKTITVLHDRLTAMLRHLREYLADTTRIHTDWLEVIKREDRTSYIFANEYTTLVSMLAQNCFFLDPDIRFVIPQSENPNSSSGSVEISHDDATNLLIRAAEKSLRDLEIVRAAFA